MDEKSILEVAFEWICECGAYEQLKKQYENYAADVTVRYNRELKHETFLSTRTSTGSDFARNMTSRVTDVK